MKYIKKNFKVIIAFILGAILASGVTVYAVINAGSINYTKEGTQIQNVEQALNDLYEKNKTKNTTRTLVATLEWNSTSYNIDMTSYEGWQNFTTENFAVVVTGIYANEAKNRYRTFEDSNFSYDATTGNLHIDIWCGISAVVDLRYSAKVYLYR